MIDCMEATHQFQLECIHGRSRLPLAYEGEFFKGYHWVGL